MSGASPECSAGRSGGSGGPQAECYRITHVRGPMARRFRAMVIQQGGEAAWNRLLGLVGPECRARYSRELGSFEWVEADLAAEIGETWEAYGGEGSTATRGQGAAREILDGTHPWLLRIATPWILVQAMPRIFGFYYRGAELHLDRTGEGGADFSLRAYGYYPSWYSVGVPAWAREALHLAGAEGVTVTHLPPGASEHPWLHRYEVRWQG